jgi:alpha-tubulin suppressor-like RCC1 family protein
VAATLALAGTIISTSQIATEAAGTAPFPGTAWAWGSNAYGGLGNGTTMQSSNPVAVSLPSGTTVTALAGGGDHSLALTRAGQVLAWGYNGDGELGNGTTTNSSTPVAVSLPSGAAARCICRWSRTPAATPGTPA